MSLAEYKVGLIASLFGSAKSRSDCAQPDYFSQRPAVDPLASAWKQKQSVDSNQADESSRAPVKKKQKTKAEKEKTKSAEKKKLKPGKNRNSTLSASESRKNAPQHSSGFQPPPGIIHESLAAGDKKLKKRKIKAAEEDDDDADDDDSQPIIHAKRPRRDRLKKAAENRTVFVGNVPLTTEKKDLTRLFRTFGEVESIRFRCVPVADPTTKKKVAVIKKLFHEKRHNFSAYICFKQEESAKKALSLNGHVLDGLHLRVDLAGASKKHDTKRSIFVGNLPMAAEEEDVRGHFEDCGRIVNVRIVRERKTLMSKQFCYVQFETADSVNLALKFLNAELMGRKLRIQRCVQQPKKQVHKGTHRTTPKSRAGKEAASKPGKKTTKLKNRMWRPTNASDAQFIQTQKTAQRRKWRLADKKKAKSQKADEVTRVMGPLQQPAQRSSSVKHNRTVDKKNSKKQSVNRKNTKNNYGGKKSNKNSASRNRDSGKGTGKSRRVRS